MLVFDFLYLFVETFADFFDSCMNIVVLLAHDIEVQEACCSSPSRSWSTCLSLDVMQIVSRVQSLQCDVDLL